MIMLKEIILDDYAFLVSETDERGIINFASDDFCRIAEYSVDELIGKPHNILRHPDMPKEAFKDLWETVKKGKMWRGFVKNSIISYGRKVKKTFSSNSSYFFYLYILFHR